MKQRLSAIGTLIERIKINAISREMRQGRAVWIKRRRPFAVPLLVGANGFFSLAETPVRAIADRAEWQRWEIGSFALLHGPEGFRAFADDANSVGADEMPGINMTRHLDGGTLTPRMAASAARELRRAHAANSEVFGGLWSHGDPHMGNFIYDEDQDRTRIIDFEVIHDQGLSARDRHADDLLVFLQDMVGRICPDRWLPCARAFLEAYDSPEILRLLEPRLSPPRKIVPRLWWSVRTTFLSVREAERRITALRRDLEIPAVGHAELAASRA